ncbi:MAG: three-Cys-motif partner protein TcmP [Candidatus Acidiferrales bacterium]
MIDASFFDESSEQSEVKSRIVAKYFWAWAKVVIPSAKTHGNRIAYIDLFAGPGRYKDGTDSTPILVLKKAIADPDMRKMLVTVFNDKTEENISSLTKAIDALPGIEQLKHKPQVRREEVGTEIVKMFEHTRLIPTLFFVDPWGYKGLSLALMNSVLKDWGCDCILFFNYNRINMGLTNVAVREHMNALFGDDRADRIRGQLDGLNPDERETFVVEELSQALKEMGAKYVLPFGFESEHRKRTSHHLIFATKDFKGYKIMKEIMAKESSDHDQGVPSFTYTPALRKYPTLFELSRPLDDLEDMLLAEFASQELNMREIYERHNVGRSYISGNYKKALIKMENEGRIKAKPPASERRKLTFGDDVIAIFPREVKK